MHMISAVVSDDLYEAVAGHRQFDPGDYARRLNELPGGWPSPQALGLLGAGGQAAPGNRLARGAPSAIVPGPWRDRHRGAVTPHDPAEPPAPRTRLRRTGAQNTHSVAHASFKLRPTHSAITAARCAVIKSLRTVCDPDHGRAGRRPGRIFMHRERWAWSPASAA
jgi:hypothetical protein